ncbi:MAG: sulfurtransferase complex subunit TusD [Pseudomonadota bacterium]
MSTTRFSLSVQSTGQANRLAQRFALATLARGDTIEQVFFYHDGVHAASGLLAPAEDDAERADQWPTIADRGGFPLYVCIAAGARRGLVDTAEAERHGLPGPSLDPAFELVGLGSFVEGLLGADRLITFGNG